MKPTVNIQRSSFDQAIISLATRSWVVACFATIILIAGVVGEILGWQFNLPRSGSLLVAFAIAVFYVNHLSGKLEVNNDDMLNRLTYLNDPMGQRQIAEQFAKNGKLTREQAQAYLKISAPLLLEKANEDHKLIILSRERLYALEAVIGITGTIAWGFGDLI